MIELPEAIVLARQLEIIKFKTVKAVFPPTKLHKFCFFHGDVSKYHQKLKNQIVEGAKAFGMFVEIVFEKYRLAFNDGVNIRLLEPGNTPKDYQLLIEFTDGFLLVFTVSMYGGIALHDGNYDNEYYLKSQKAISPFSRDFEKYFLQILEESNLNLSAKAFLATEQRFPGLGNGTLQDILFRAKINPKRKIGSLTKNEVRELLTSIIEVIQQVSDLGGRDTEKDLFGAYGEYKTKMSKNTYKKPCPNCLSEIKKEAYLGGSIYYCSECQKI